MGVIDGGGFIVGQSRTLGELRDIHHTEQSGSGGERSLRFSEASAKTRPTVSTRTNARFGTFPLRNI